MKIYKNILSVISLLASFSIQAQECNSQLIDWNNYDKTLKMLQASYHEEKYTSVEIALNCLLNSKRTFLSGKPGAIATYWFYRNEMHAPGADKLDEQRIEKWKKAIKDSPYANFAELRLMYSQAWNERGTKYANETTKQQFKRFREKLLTAESAILSDKNKLKNTPISYNLLMAVTLDTSGTQSSPTEVFKTGITNWPNYYDFYEVFLTRLVPKWGGSWENVDAFINHYSEKLKEKEGNSLYARLYYNVHKHNRINPHQTKVDWNKLKPSLVSLYTKYPAKVHFEIASSYACFFADYNFFNQLVSKHSVKSSNAWLAGSSVERCHEYFKTLSEKSIKQES